MPPIEMQQMEMQTQQMEGEQGEGEEEAEKEEEEEKPAPPEVAATPRPLDPVKMHAAYQDLRTKLLKTTAAIACLQNKPGDYTERIARMEAVRDRIQRRAYAIKTRYDTFFGAAEQGDNMIGHVIHEVAGTPAPAEESDQEEEEEQQQGVTSTPSPAVDVAAPLVPSASAGATYVVFGDRPEPRYGFGCTGAHVEAARCIVGNTMNPCKHDCHVDIGSAEVVPLTFQGVLIGSAETEPTSNHDQAGDMVNAVITDLTSFLKDAKQRSIHTVLFSPDPEEPEPTAPNEDEDEERRSGALFRA